MDLCEPAGGDVIVTEAQVRQALGAINDPCSLATARPVDIVTLGLVERIEIDEQNRVLIGLVLTQPTCWFFFDLSRYIEESVGAIPGVADVRVEIDASHVWTPDRIAVHR